MAHLVRCEYHPDAVLVEDSHAGDLICPQCGLVVGDRVVDVGSEWRTFSNSEGVDRCRVGDAQNELLDGGLSTSIAYTSDARAYDEHGKPLFTQRNVMSSNDRALVAGFREISQICERMGCPKTISDRANALFKQLIESKQMKGRTTAAMAAACVHIACRQEGVGRTFKEIVAVSRVSKRDLGRVFTLAKRYLETSVSLITTGDFMVRFCSNLDLPPSLNKVATHVAKRVVDLDLCSGRSPVSIASAVIYLVSQTSANKKSAKEIAEVVGAGVSALQTSYRMLLPKAHDLFPDEYHFATALSDIPAPTTN